MALSNNVVVMSRWKPVKRVSLKGQYWDQYYLVSSSVTQTVGLSAPSVSLQTTKLTCVVNMLKGRDAIQRDLGRLEQCT